MIKVSNSQELTIEGRSQRDGSTVKSICYTCRGPSTSMAAHSRTGSDTLLWPLLAPVMHVVYSVQANTYTHKTNLNKINIKNHSLKGWHPLVDIIWMLGPRIWNLSIINKQGPTN